MKATHWTMLALCLCLVGCVEREGEGMIAVNVTIRNASALELKGITLEWHGSFVPGGAMRPGVEKTAVGVQWPAAEYAMLEMIDAASGEKHRVALALNDVGEKVRAGNCREVVIEVSSREAVVVYCRGGGQRVE